MRAISPGIVRVGLPRGTGRILTQEIFLEPIGTDVIFAAPRALTVRLAMPGLLVDDTGGLAVAVPAARLRYTVESELEPRFRRAGPAVRPLDTGARERYLQLPPLPAQSRSSPRGQRGQRDGARPARRLTIPHPWFRYSLVSADGG